ncbi:sigma-70 family RNA polymerase sigma factor [Oharaeibacter diazotrophicus]|uniref:RNA polymerase sigma factor n=1 Tax=Oharaeibacter diazotrophicus TaxID=1920512 RepID=A0A4R6RCY5_9HYPH|nr:sigma-70 family RNA polymerase sigma factor [Oharaeibacter diazotrophicus]TDP83577.1 RNA polymerase RpoE-like sigma-24 subunit [Oharaeibacter diazotrophicus]BBE72410.1 ECF RNA polymerase sigma factor SigR [Pleomorphomonas sp. SM30]GLS79180.1 RNA polymerase sigma factor [Oharaeibacter diazotrophicus]
MTERRTDRTEERPALRDELLAAIPPLRAFAVSLTADSDRADDLVQETLVKAWSNLGSFTPGTNMRAWLFTILRNTFYSNHRKRRREVQDVEGEHAARLATHPAQNGHMDLADFREALGKLPPDQREALILIGASGFSYEEAAEICGCAVGTVKSRVNRARNRLAELMSISSAEAFGPDDATQAIVGDVVSTRSGT